MIAATWRVAFGSERRAQLGWIPGSVPVADAAGLQLEPHSQVVVYCDCPNDASAAVAAMQLRKQGFSRVRPLAGGIEAWNTRGLPLDRPAADPMATP